MARRRFGSDVEAAITAASQRWNIPANVLRTFAHIESSGNPRAATGSYQGLFQLSNDEFRRGGGQGSIFDPHQNAMAAGRLIAGHRAELARALGREPSWNEVYLAHQQGIGGIQEHIRNPGGLAWENMASTAEGRRRDAQGPVYRMPDGSRGLWSQAAVAGNLPRAANLDWRTATSGDFVQAWGQRLERGGIPQPLPVVASDMDAAVPDMNPHPPGTPRDLSALSASELTRMAGPREAPVQSAGLEPAIDQVVAAIPRPTVEGTNSIGNLNVGNIFGQKNIAGASSIGNALSAAGKAIAGSGIKVPQFEDPAKQMAALEQGAAWPTIQARPQRRPPGFG